MAFRSLFWVPAYFMVLKTQVVADWRYVQTTGSYYHISKTRMPYAEAVCYCSSLRSSLIIVDTLTEMDYIDIWLQATLQGYWTGATDEKQDRNFVWSDGTPVMPELWNLGEPNNKDGIEHRGVLTVAQWVGDVNITLGDLEETANRYALCERNTNVKTLERFWQAVSREVIYNGHVIESIPNITSILECFMECQKSCRCMSAIYQFHTLSCYMYDTFSSRFTGISEVCPGCIGFE